MSNSCLVSEDAYYPLIASLSTSAIAVLTCLATVIMVCVLKLHKILFYRLALYQVLSAIKYTVIWITIAAYRADELYNGSAFGDLDKTVAVLRTFLVGSAFIKLMFTFWIAIHLFALAVFHKNLQRFSWNLCMW